MAYSNQLVMITGFLSLLFFFFPYFFLLSLRRRRSCLPGM